MLLMMQENKKKLIKLINQSIQEDIGRGDITSSLLIPNKQKGISKILVKEDCVIAGIAVCKLVCECIDNKLKAEFTQKDGDFIKKNTIIGTISGPISSILAAERVILNFMQRMSGIATKTNEYVKLINKTKTRILDTRKTTPNFRIFEKMAVRIGGGINHRFGLYDEILVKDNHIEANGDIKKTLERLKLKLKKKNTKYKVIVEVKDLHEFKIASEYSFIDRILLDNMSVLEIKEIVKINQGKIKLEASGGINGKTLLEYVLTGIDFVSIGELTHHFKSIDIALNLKK
jgi:nicotinate-nucleotide pyrophosphorylase (carboxylating)